MALEQSVPSGFAAFRSAGPPDLVVSLHVAQSVERCGGMPAFKADLAWNLWAKAEQRTLIYDAGTPQTPLARMDWHTRWPRTVTLHSASDPAELLFEYPLLPFHVIEWLASRHGMLLHAGATVVDDTAVVFAGPPEAGKSTLARLCAAAGLPLLCDDRVVLQQADSRFVVSGTPWHSTTPLVAPRQAPIAALVFLQHGQSNQLNPLSPTQALRRLATEVFLPLWEQPLVAHVLETMAALIETIPCYELAFVPDAAVVDVLRYVVRQ